jgi:hypothetical protein
VLDSEHCCLLHCDSTSCGTAFCLKMQFNLTPVIMDFFFLHFPYADVIFQTKPSVKRAKGRRKRLFKSFVIEKPVFAPLARTSSPAPPPEDNNDLPLSGDSISPQTLARHALVQEATVTPVVDSSPVQDKRQKLIKKQLQKINRKHDDWQLVDLIETLDVPKWFEQQVCYCFDMRFDLLLTFPR